MLKKKNKKFQFHAMKLEREKKFMGKIHEKKIKISVPWMNFKYRKVIRITVGKFGMKHARKKSNVSKKKL